MNRVKDFAKKWNKSINLEIIYILRVFNGHKEF